MLHYCTKYIGKTLLEQQPLAQRFENTTDIKVSTGDYNTGYHSILEKEEQQSRCRLVSVCSFASSISLEIAHRYRTTSHE